MFFEIRTAQKVGKRTGASVVLIGKIVPDGRAAKAHVRLVDVQTGKAILAASERIAKSSLEPTSPGKSASKPKKAVRHGPPAEEKTIAEDFHNGEAGYAHRGNVYRLKVAPELPKVVLADTVISFEAWARIDKTSVGDVFLSTDYGGKWTRIYQWTTSKLKQAKRRGNWLTVDLKPIARKFEIKEADEVQVKFRYTAGLDALMIKRVVWSRH